MIVVDASVLANAVGDDGLDGRRIRRDLKAAGDLAAPALVDVETVAVLRKRWLAGTLTEQRFAAAVGDLEDLEVDRYVALAETLDCELWTGNRRLANAHGPRCAIRMLG